MAKPFSLNITQEDIDNARGPGPVVYERDMDSYQSPYGAITVLYLRRKGVWVDHTSSPYGIAMNRQYRDLGWRQVLFVGDETIIKSGGVKP